MKTVMWYLGYLPIIKAENYLFQPTDPNIANELSILRTIGIFFFEATRISKERERNSERCLTFVIH